MDQFSTMRALAYCAAILVASAAPSEARADDSGATTRTDADAPRISIDRSKVDLKQHRLEIVLSREATKLTYQVTGDSGAVLADQETDLTGRPAGVPLVVTWSPTTEESPTRIDLRAEDSLGHWAKAWLLPWSVSIPHREVLFKTGSWRIEDTEKPKLEESYAQIADAVARHQELGTVTLFVAGHTDTVGRAADNFRLSRDRARAIAGWFRERGLRIPIAFEGFGESALLVKTADEVDEPRNRRADYIVAFEEPAIPAVGFRPAWQRLK
jgi:outer membrane protein OmpA-like peptidoglycan-associated protein